MSSNELFLKFQTTGQSIEQLSKFIEQKEDVIEEKVKDIKLLNKIEEFNKKYSKLKGIKRFSIPIIGKCNSGKSTFLNFPIASKKFIRNES